MKPILEIQHISKKFQIQHETQRYLSLRDSIAGLFNNKQTKKEDFWALKDVSFDVYPGDSIGIIGKNGAGKSTLLKILSKITPPTSGKIISRGRIASLLEVGTGFHPELTGRENIYLNGSILGLKKVEINKQFDAIVDFSGVEKFIDTPLKHYSSGMQLRLAFAVAAHLEPEILIIDEILAVGDSDFQKRCMGKMDEVSKSGRTVLFVSHNSAALKSLCPNSFLLANGKITDSGKTEDVINKYMSVDVISEVKLNLNENFQRKQSKQGLRFKSVEFNKGNYLPGDNFEMKLEIDSDGNNYNELRIGITLSDNLSNCIIHLSNVFIDKSIPKYEPGKTYTFIIPDLNIKPGNYSITLFLQSNGEIQDWIMNQINIVVLEGNIYGHSDSSIIQGIIQPRFDVIVK